MGDKVALSPGIICIIVLLLGLAGNTFSEPAAYNVSYKTVLETADADSNYWTGLAPKITGLGSGQTALEDSLLLGLERLKLSGWFRDVNLILIEESNNPEARFVLKLPPLLIEDVNVGNPEPLFEEEILKSISIRSGDLLQWDKLEMEKNSIAQYLSEEGVLCDSIQLALLPGSTDSNRKILFKLINAKTFQIKSFVTRGINGWESFILKNKIMGFQRVSNFFPGKRFRLKILEKELRALKESYLDKGYYDAVLNHNIELDSSKLEVRLNLNLIRGKKYKISLEGNHRAKKLKKQLAFGRGNKRNIGLKKSVNQIRDHCFNQGFLNARVEGKLDSLGSKKTVRIVIEEGRQYVMDSITIEGASAKDSLEILKRLLHLSGPFHPNFLYEEKMRINAYYLEKGYVNTTVDTGYGFSNSKRKNYQIPVNVRYIILPGPQGIVRQVSFPDFGTDIQKILHESGEAAVKNKPFNYKVLTAAQNSIGIKLSELGYPHNQVKFQKITLRDSGEIKINWNIELGPRVYFGNLYIKGNFKTKNRVVQKGLEMKSGQPFSLVKTLESQRNWQNLGMFNHIELNTLGLLEKRDSVQLMLSVEERKTEYLKIKIGLESDRGGFLESELGNENLWGLNKHGWLHAGLSHRDVDEIKWNEFGWNTETGISDPAFLDFNVYASFIAGYYRKLEVGKQFFEESFYSSLNFHKPIWKFIETGIGLEYELRRSEGLVASVDSSYRNNILLGPYTKVDSRNSFIRPLRGIYTRFGVDFSVNLDGFEKDNFVRYSWVGKSYYTPISNLTLAGELAASVINDSSLAVDQKAYLGGSSNVRGYLKNGMDPDGGNISVSGSLELRWEFFKNLESVFFIDAGFLKSHPNPIPYFTDNLNELKWTPGLGINYITPIGPIGIHYGHRLNPIEYGAWHFLIGYSI